MSQCLKCLIKFTPSVPKYLSFQRFQMNYHIRMYIDIFQSVDSLILFCMQPLIEISKRLIFGNGGSIKHLQLSILMYRFQWLAKSSCSFSCSQVGRRQKTGENAQGSLQTLHREVPCSSSVVGNLCSSTLFFYVSFVHPFPNM